MLRQPHNDLKTWILWLIANIMPWWLIWILMRPWGARIDGGVLPGLAPLFMLWELLCALVGIAQWWVIKKRLTDMGRWPIATVLGGVIAFWGFWTLYAAPLIVGGTFGIAQWLILRHRVQRAWLWIVAQVLAAIAGATAMLWVSMYVLFVSFDKSIFIVVSTIELAASLVTGSVLIYLLRQRQTPC